MRNSNCYNYGKIIQGIWGKLSKKRISKLCKTIR
jgi:hypothetical protein